MDSPYACAVHKIKTELRCIWRNGCTDEERLAVNAAMPRQSGLFRNVVSGKPYILLYNYVLANRLDLLNRYTI